MRFEVRLTADAVRDLEEIDDWIASRDSPASAAPRTARTVPQEACRCAQLDRELAG